MKDPLVPNQRQIEHFASQLHVAAVFLLSLGSSSLFVAVLLASHFHVWGFSNEELVDIQKLRGPTVLLCAGLGGFSLFFPWFLALYFCRYFLSAIARLETKIASLE
jgi:hypothetical protein